MKDKYYKTEQEAIFSEYEAFKEGKNLFTFTRATSPENVEWYCLESSELDSLHKRMLIGDLFHKYKKLPDDCKEEFNKLINEE